MKLCVMAHIPLAACAPFTQTGGSRRRQGAVVPIGTKTVVETFGEEAKWSPLVVQLYYLIYNAIAQPLHLNQPLEHSLR